MKRNIRLAADLDRLYKPSIASYPGILNWTMKHTKYEVTEILQNAGIAATPVQNTEDLLNDPHLRERGFFVEVDQPGVAKWPFCRTWRMSDTPGGIQGHPPSEGQDNEYVYSELLGLSKDEIERLISEKVIY